MNEISLWLDSYDDIYSDFDSRHYLKRRISEDFVEELRIAFKYRHEQPEAVILCCLQVNEIPKLNIPLLPV